MKTLKARIKRKLKKHLKELGFIRTSDGLLRPPDNSKERIRLLHKKQRTRNLQDESGFIEEKIPKLFRYFSSGQDIDPESIRPRIQMIESGTWESDLFRLASLTWSIPVSHGYGRRMRFLIWDKNNGKLIGLIALGDPVFNLGVRDRYIGWDVEQRKEHLVNVMDAYVLGALPPYNMLLCGKLISCLIRSREIKDAFSKKYGNTRGIISGKKKEASLTLVTTSSALGKSSVYDRLKLDGLKYMIPIGYTSGWGHFHIPDDLFSDLRDYLRLVGDFYEKNYRFGNGPNWRLRVVRKSLALIGLNPNLLRHGIKRQVYICRLATNPEEYLRGEVNRPDYNDLLSVNEISSRALERWVVPRSIRRPDYVHWKKSYIMDLLKPEKDSTISLSFDVEREKRRPRITSVPHDISLDKYNVIKNAEVTLLRTGIN